MAENNDNIDVKPFVVVHKGPEGNIRCKEIVYAANRGDAANNSIDKTEETELFVMGIAQMDGSKFIVGEGGLYLFTTNYPKKYA